VEEEEVLGADSAEAVVDADNRGEVEDMGEVDSRKSKSKAKTFTNCLELLKTHRKR